MYNQSKMFLFFTLLILFFILSISNYAQNSPLNVWGSGLDGSTYQRTGIFSDATKGLYFAAPLNSTGVKLPIQFSWQSGEAPALYIDGNSSFVGIGTTNPTNRLSISDGNLTIDNYDHWLGVASPGSNGTSFARLLGTDAANSVDRAVITSNGYIRISDGALVQDNPTLPTWAVTLDANNDAVYFKRAQPGSNSQSTLNSLLTINNSGNVGIGTTNPTNRLSISDGNLTIDNYDHWLGVASPGSSGTSFARLLGTDVANSVDRAVITSNGYIRTYDGVLVQDNPTLPTWAVTLDANNDAVYFKRAQPGSNSQSALNSLLTINNSGNVGIGTSNPSYKLDIIGTIRAQEIQVNLDGADFVFSKDYELKSIETLNTFVKKHGHLPGIPKATEMQENGVNIGEFNNKLLQKIEELTLYIFELNNDIKLLQKENIELKNRLVYNK